MEFLERGGFEFDLVSRCVAGGMPSPPPPPLSRRRRRPFF